MDYEKKYNEALKRGKAAIDVAADRDLVKSVAITIFPELAESEDERIRKFLVEYFTSYKIGNVATKLNGYRIDDILAFLEKQKEQECPEVNLEKTVEFECIGKKVKMTIQELINYYIDSEICDVADECGF